MRVKIQTRKTVTKSTFGSKEAGTRQTVKTPEYHKSITLSLTKNSSLEERKVIRAIFLSNASNSLCYSSLPETKGRKGYLHFQVSPPMSTAEFNSLQAAPRLQVLSAPEKRAAILEEKKKEDALALERSEKTHRIAKSLGLYKLVPKDLRPKFECRCGMGFKKKVKLDRHQRKCAVLKDARDVLELCALVKGQLKESKPKVSKAVNNAKPITNPAKRTSRKGTNHPSKTARKKATRGRA